MVAKAHSLTCNLCELQLQLQLQPLPSALLLQLCFRPASATCCALPALTACTCCLLPLPAPSSAASPVMERGAEVIDEAVREDMRRYL